MNLNLPNLLEILCIFVFGSIIFVWVVRYNNIKDEFKTFNLPKWLRDLVGILKLSLPSCCQWQPGIRPPWRQGIAILMVAALITHLRLNGLVIECSLPFFTMHMLLCCRSLSNTYPAVWTHTSMAYLQLTVQVLLSGCLPWAEGTAFSTHRCSCPTNALG